MTARRVIAYGIDETEISAAREIMSGSIATEAFVVGMADDGQLDRLRRAGLVVAPVERDGLGEPETPGKGSLVNSDVPRPRSTVFSDRVRGPLPDPDPNVTNVYLVQIPGPILEEYRSALADAGVELIESLRNGFYTAVMTPEQVRAVQALAFVSSLSVYDGDQTVLNDRMDVQTLAPEQPAHPDLRMLVIDVVLHLPSDAGDVIAWLDERRIPVAGSAGRKVRAYLIEDHPDLAALAGLRQVARIEEFVPPVLWNDRARALLGLDAVPPSHPFPLDGSGEIVGVADTGLDESHPDFVGRISVVIALGRPVADDPHGHGTHVAGSVLGNGSASDGTFRGTAPGASLVFQSLLDARGGLGGLPLDLGMLFEEAYGHGARIHNNSWGSATRSTYTISSDEVDAFAAARRDMLIVFAAGNEGRAADRLNSETGVVDWLSIGAPGTAKNALTVGASRSDRRDGGFSGMTWGEAWSSDFPEPPISEQRISGDRECLAAFSSRGPSDDRRIKPDVVAPGTDILSCRSAKAPRRNFWEGYEPNHHYAFMGGTSMAAPLVSGFAAVARQYFRTKRGHDAPSAALLRATIVNGARWLTGTDANASNLGGITPPANFDQGFGAVDMATTLPASDDDLLKIAFKDEWQVAGRAFTASGQRHRFRIDVGGRLPLRICLCYADAPGRGLQNNLNLFVQLPGGEKRTGNERLRHSLGLPDVDNNVEVVRIGEPAPGGYVIQVTAANILRPPQDYALIVSGDLGGDLTTW